MRIAYQYRLRPTDSQITLMNEWLELLRKQYNYRWQNGLTGGSETVAPSMLAP